MAPRDSRCSPGHSSHLGCACRRRGRSCPCQHRSAIDSSRGTSRGDASSWIGDRSCDARRGAISSPSRTKMAASSRLRTAGRRSPRSVSNTGWTSVGELEMTRRISPVAVCCSSVSVRSRLRALQLLEQADVLDRDHRLVGEGLEEGDLSLREELRLGAAEGDRADRDSFSHQGDVEDRAEAHAPRVLAALREFVHFGLHVSDVDGPPVQHRSASDSSRGRAGERTPRRGRWGSRRDARRGGTSPSRRQMADVERLAQASGALRHGVEHGLDVGRRARDDAQDLACRRLLLQRLGQVAVARLQFLEQADVLDRDHRLVGERLEQRHLPARRRGGPRSAGSG